MDSESMCTNTCEWNRSDGIFHFPSQIFISQITALLTNIEFWKVQMARGGGVNSLFKILQTLLNKWVSKISGEAILALAQLSYASHLYKLARRLNTKTQQEEKATQTKLTRYASM